MTFESYAPRVERGRWLRHRGRPGRLYWCCRWHLMPYLFHRWDVLDDHNWFAGFFRRSQAEAWVREYYE